MAPVKIQVNQNLSIREIMTRYGLPKTTAWRAKKRGWFAKDYHKKFQPLETPPDRPDPNFKSKVQIDTSLSVSQIMHYYNLPKTTARRAKKQGWFFQNHARKEQPTKSCPPDFPTDQAYKAALDVFGKKFRRFEPWKDDMVATAVLRMVELSAISTDFPYQWRIAYNEMRDFVRKNRLETECFELMDWKY